MDQNAKQQPLQLTGRTGKFNTPPLAGTLTKPEPGSQGSTALVRWWGCLGDFEGLDKSEVRNGNNRRT